MGNLPHPDFLFHFFPSHVLSVIVARSRKSRPRTALRFGELLEPGSVVSCLALSMIAFTKKW